MISDQQTDSIIKPPNELRKARILAWPRSIAVDPYYKRLSDGLESYGWKVDDFSYWQALRRSYAIIHIHGGTFPFRNKRIWITLARLGIAIALISLAKARGGRIVWSLHNLASHEQYHPRLEAAFLNWLSRTLNLSIHMSESGRIAAIRRYPALASRPSHVIPLMHFGESYGVLPTYSEGRKQLGLDSKMRAVLFLGQIRPYKNVPALMRLFSELPERDVRLFIVGHPKDEGARNEICDLASDPRIVLSLEAAPIENVKIYMAASSLVVAPYREILNSGSALLALTHRRPVLLPALGAMLELQSNVGRDWVRLYDPPLTTQVLKEALDWATKPRSSTLDLSHYAPARVVESHAVAFAQLETSAS